MAKRFLFGTPPFNILASHLAQDSDFLRDAEHILTLNDDEYRRLATQLAKTDSFLNRDALISVAGDAIDSAEEADQLAKIIHKFGRIVHDADMDAGDAMNILARAIESEAESLSEEQRQELVERIRKLVADPIGIAKQFKARQLVDAIGAELDDFRLVCDMRPLFDRSRERIEGVIPVTVLRLEYSTPDGATAVAEVRVTEAQLNEFEEKIAGAKRKLSAIKEHLAICQVAIPKTKSTISPGEG